MTRSSGKATPELIGLTFAAAYEWREHDGQAAAALEMLKDGLREHHGLDVDAVLGGDVQDLNQAQRQVADRVLGRYVVPVEALAYSLGDRDRARSDQVLADAELAQAQNQLEQNLDETAAVADLDDPAERQTFVERAQQQQYAADPAGHVDHDQARLKDTQGRPPYAVYRAGEAPDASRVAEKARLASAVHFPTSAAQTLRGG